MDDDDACDVLTILGLVAGVFVAVVLCIVAQYALCPNP